MPESSSARAEAISAVIDVVDVDRHVGAAVAVEDERKGVAVADAEEDERGQALRVGRDVADVDALGREPLAHEAAVLLVADAGQHRRLEAEPRQPTAVLAGEPPRYFANERMSSRRPPICSP